MISIEDFLNFNVYIFILDILLFIITCLYSLLLLPLMFFSPLSYFCHGSKHSNLMGLYRIVLFYDILGILILLLIILPHLMVVRFLFHFVSFYMILGGKLFFSRTLHIELFCSLVLPLSWKQFYVEFFALQVPN